MKIALIHYHLRAGGVTRVLQTQQHTLASEGHEVAVLSEEILPGLGYSDHSDQTGDDLLRDCLRALPWQPDLWLLHNPTLGKSVIFPAFVNALAASGAPLLLQCHDFVEDGRPGNYHRVGAQELYPLANHVHYGFVNSRDRDCLITAGLPATHCHYLPNEVVPPKPLDDSVEGLPLVLYPVRGIRRKNLGELLLLAKHVPPGTRFAIGLAPENPEWQMIHDRWAQTASELGLEVLFDVTDKISPQPGANPSFASWLGHATHAVTTSIAEGFGFSFLEPSLCGLPLFGRDLPAITQDFSPTPPKKLGTLYQSIPIPAEFLDLAELTQRLKSTYSNYGRTMTAELLERVRATLIRDDQIDFGNLLERDQKRALRSLHLPWLSDWLTKALSEKVAGETQLPDARQCLIDTLNIVASSTSSPVSHLPKSNVLDQFLQPEHFHFLRT